MSLAVAALRSKTSKFGGKSAELLYGSENVFVLFSEAKDAWDCDRKQ